ncbi:hypothetical protein Tco_0536467 [Tanacetum coccineum]
MEAETVAESITYIAEDQAPKKLEVAQEQERYEAEMEAIHKEIDSLQDKLVADAKLQKKIHADGDMKTNDNAHTLKERLSPYGVSQKFPIMPFSARERGEQAVVERATAEFTQRALTEPRVTLQKACEK